MATITNPYDALYTNLKNRFTVISDGRECTVAEFMLEKAGKKRANESALTVAGTTASTRSINTFMDYVNDKLTVKSRPAKDITIRKFPIRASVSAMLSAVAACALVLSCGIFALSGAANAVIPATAEISEIEELDVIEATEETNIHEIN